MLCRTLSVCLTCLFVSVHLNAHILDRLRGALKDASLWLSHPEFTPPDAFINGNQDSGMEIVDLNSDHRADLIQYTWLNRDNIPKGAWLSNGSGWNSTSAYIPPTALVDYGSGGCPDNGVRFVELNGDGYIDMIKSIWTPSQNLQSKAWFNANPGWNETDSRFNLPVTLVNNCQDGGAVFLDLTGTGTDSVVYNVYFNPDNHGAGAFINTGNGWVSAPQFTPPAEITFYRHPGCYDNGVRFLDLNSDGLQDMIQSVWYPGPGLSAGAWLNGGAKQGWQRADARFVPPPTFINTCQDSGVRMVDLDGDGLLDLVQYAFLNRDNIPKGAWINTGKGWQSVPQYTPPVAISDYGTGGCPDNGVRFFDLNHDGIDDIIQSVWVQSQGLMSHAWLNTGNGWEKVDGKYLLPPTIINSCADSGVRFADVDGDGQPDAIQYAYLNRDNIPKGAWLNNPEN